MPAPTTTVSFLDVARKSGLLKQKHLDELFGDSAPGDPNQCAALLVKAELLTAYQAKQLLGGKFRGFFLGPYKILRPIGQGGMGAVYLAEHTSLGRKVAVKVLTAEKAKDKLTLERFHREARAAAALDHPNIVRLHDISQGAGVHFLVMEYVDGNDLQTLMAQTGPLHFAQAAQYIAQAAAGLQHAHERGFVHRDVKPANLMLTKDGGIKILDMGLARSFTDARDNLTGLLAEGDIAGTVDFLSPEQAMNHPLDERSDIYSLGATFYALVTGHPPFNGSTAQKLMQHQLKDPPSLTVKLRGRVPDALSNVISKMMAKRASERFQAAADVIDALGPWLPAVTTGNIVQDPLTTSSITPPPKRSATRPLRPSTRLPASQAVAAAPLWKRPPVLIGAGVGAALLVVGVVLALVLGGGSNTAATTSVPTNYGPQYKPPVQANTNPHPPRYTPPPPRAGGKALYAVDFATTPPASRTVPPPGRSVVLTDLAGVPLPPGVSLNHWNGQTAAVYSVADRGGGRALGLQPTAGHDGVQAHFKCDGLFTALPAGGTANVRLTYALDGTRPANAFVELRADPYPKYEVTPLPPTGGQWKAVDLTFTRPPDGGEYELVARANDDRAAVDGTLWVKAVEVLDPAAPAPAGGGASVYRLDGQRVNPFREKGSYNYSPQFDHLQKVLPGWKCEVWDKDSDGEFVAERADGKIALGVSPRAGKNAAQLVFRPHEVPGLALTPGRQYEARVEYRAEPGSKAWANVQTMDEWKQVGGTGLDDAADWRTVSFPVVVPDGRQVQLTFGTGTPGGFVRIRSLELTDPAAGGPVFRLSAADLPTFRNTKTGSQVTQGTQPDLGKGLYMHGHKSDTAGEYFCEQVDGQKAVGWANAGGPASGQIGIELEGTPPAAAAPLVAGKKYRTQVVYKTTGGTRGAVYVQTYDDWKIVDDKWNELPDTGGQWKTFEYDWTKPAGKVRLLVDNQGTGPAAILYVREVSVTEVDGRTATTAPAPARAAPPPVAPKSNLPAVPVTADFAKFTDGTFPVTNDGVTVGDGWTAGMYEKDATGEVSVAAQDGGKVLTLANTAGKPSVQVYQTAAGPPLAAGRSYLFKFEYRASEGTAGAIEVREKDVLNWMDCPFTYKLEATGDQWEKRTFEIEAGRDYPPVFVIQNRTGTPGNRLSIRSLEITPLGGK